MDYLHRRIESVLREAVDQFPVVVLTGPRQSGKTTLLRKLFGDSYTYLSMDEPDTRRAAMADPRGFLDIQQKPLILDEVQYVPDLFHFIRGRVDSARSVHGQYILTGSQNFALLEKISESLAGRVAILNLLGLDHYERAGHPNAQLPWQQATFSGVNTGLDIWNSILRGCYPEVATGMQQNWKRWHDGYRKTYLERDVRSIQKIADQFKFGQFLRLLASRSGSLLNYTDIARDLGIGTTTVHEWISVLEASYQVQILNPWYVNIGKQLSKTPKIYLTDSGQLCSLLGIGSVDQLRRHPLVGNIFETAVVSEIRRNLVHTGEDPRLFFWRTKAGTEVDLLIHLGDEIIPVEIKSTATVRPELFSSIRQLKKDLPELVKRGYLVHSGPMPLPFKDEMLAVPFSYI